MRIIVFLSLIITATGCLPGREAFIQTDKKKPSVPSTGMDEMKAICLDVAIIKIPTSEPEIIEKIWHLADENMVPLDQKSSMDKNGFKVANFGRSPPHDVMRLLQSEKYCSNPRRLQVLDGAQTIVPITGNMESFKCNLLEENDKRLIELPSAQGLLQISPSLQDEKSFLLKVIPIVRAAESHLGPKAVKNASGNLDWEIQTVRKQEIFPKLKMEIGANNGDFIIIGCSDSLNTDLNVLGSEMFVERSAKDIVPKIVIIRPSKKLPDSRKNLGQFGKALPIAIQASWKNLELEP
jgi:hypothetical protein